MLPLHGAVRRVQRSGRGPAPRRHLRIAVQACVEPEVQPRHALELGERPRLPARVSGVDDAGATAVEHDDDRRRTVRAADGAHRQRPQEGRDVVAGAFGEGMGDPEGAAPRECRAVEPDERAGPWIETPDPAGERLVVQQAVQRHDGRALLQRRHLAREAVRAVPGIVVPGGDQLAPCEPAGEVAAGAGGQRCVEADVADAWVDDDQLERVILLAQKAPERLSDKAPPVCGSA